LSQSSKFFLTLILLQCLLFAPFAALADDDDEADDSEIDWKARFTQIIDIKTESLSNYLKNDKKGFDKLVLARVASQTPEDQNSRKYEVIWYRRGEPIGLRRLGKLPFQAPQKVALHVLHGGGAIDDEQVKAAANACLRLFLELNAKTMSPAAIFVPKQSFAPFVQRMNQMNFYSAEEPAPDTPVYTSIVLSVESEPPGLKQLLFYSGRR